MALTPHEFDAKKQELLTLQAELEAQFHSLKAELSEAFARVQDARLALHHETNQAMVDIAAFISNNFGITVDIEDIRAAQALN